MTDQDIMTEPDMCVAEKICGEALHGKACCIVSAIGSLSCVVINGVRNYLM
jgi:hypothetical protein